MNVIITLLPIFICGFTFGTIIMMMIKKDAEGGMEKIDRDKLKRIYDSINKKDPNQISFENLSANIENTVYYTEPAEKYSAIRRILKLNEEK
ncbi:hypothetical protein [Abyssalbus ytuae]|uniref:Uncharacterized protein n=1 Tax=Abyssalbus ytuae TaxID=2926907 RepID=A0A9E6ZJH5_9FLAO|nr:hypothetical protein [Abyssalbus ytuae]UOB16724.1 hypothetical protein MQE35_13375 [Abyssalbus ytuae]